MILKPITKGIKSLADLIRAVDKLSNDLIKLTRNGITFADNLDAVEVTVADTGLVDTEFSVSHTLGRVPVGFFVKTIDKGAVIYDSGTAWTDTTIYLAAGVANCNVTLYVY